MASEPEYTDPDALASYISAESMWVDFSSDERAQVCDNQDMAISVYADVLSENIATDNDINLEDPEGFREDQRQAASDFYAEECQASEAESNADGVYRYPDNTGVPFGATYEWTVADDEGNAGTTSAGIEVVISAPTEYSPSSSAAGGEGFSQHVQFTISVTNNSNDPLDLVMAMSNVQAGTREGDQIFDTGQGMEGSPMATLLPGRTVEWDEAYGVDDPNDIVVSFTPTWDYGEVYFSSGS